MLSGRWRVYWRARGRTPQSTVYCLRWSTTTVYRRDTCVLRRAGVLAIRRPQVAGTEVIAVQVPGRSRRSGTFCALSLYVGEDVGPARPSRNGSVGEAL